MLRVHNKIIINEFLISIKSQHVCHNVRFNIRILANDICLIQVNDHFIFKRESPFRFKQLLILNRLIDSREDRDRRVKHILNEHGETENRWEHVREWLHNRVERKKCAREFLQTSRKENYALIQCH